MLGGGRKTARGAQGPKPPRGRAQWFRGGLVFKAHRRLYHSTLSLRVVKKKEKIPASRSARGGRVWGGDRPPVVRGIRSRPEEGLGRVGRAVQRRDAPPCGTTDVHSSHPQGPEPEHHAFSPDGKHQLAKAHLPLDRRRWAEERLGRVGRAVQRRDAPPCADIT